MTKKNLTLVLVVVAALVAGGVILIAPFGNHEEEELVERQAGLPVDDDSTAPDEISTSDVALHAREKIEVDEQEPSDVMPESYRRALGVIKGRVVEEDGEPVPGMKVEIFGISALDFFMDASAFMSDEPPVLELRTDGTQTGEDGRFELSGIYPRAMHALAVNMGGSRPTTRILDAMPNSGETVDLGDIVLAPQAVIMGRIVDTEGEPVQGARVRATDLPPVVFISGMQDYRDGCSFLARWSSEERIFDTPSALLQFMRLVPFPTAMSDSEGAFRLEGVPRSLVTVVADRPGYVTSRKSVQMAKGGEKDAGAIELGDGVVLAGKVLDQFGDPVAGAEVRAGPMYGLAEMIVLQPPVFTNERGGFRMQGVPELSTFAAVRRYAEDAWTVVGPFHPELEPPTVTLPASYDLRLNVVLDNGSPAKKARIKLRLSHGFLDLLPIHPPTEPKERLEEVADGVLLVKGLVAGTYDILVTAPGAGVAKERITIDAEPVQKDIVLERAYAARIRVLTEEGMAPVEWAEVHARLGTGEWWQETVKLARSRTNSAGLATFRNLSPGTYKVTVSHPQYAVTTGTLEVVAVAETDTDGDTPINEEVVLLKPGGILEGVVHHGGSVDQAPYMIALNLNNSSAGPEAQMPRFSATDHEGQFRVTNLNPGSWEVNVMKRVLDQDPLGLGEVMRRGPLMNTDAEIASGETTYVELNLGARELGPTGRVSGRILVDGALAQGAMVSIWAKRRYEATVNARGLYDLGEVPVGEHNISIVSLPGATGRYDFRIRREIDVQENLPLTSDFEIMTGTIQGQAVSQSLGQPMRGVKIRARLEDQNEADFRVRMNTVTDLDGSFLFEGVPVGTYKIEAESNQFGCPPVSGVEVYARGKAGPIVLTMITPVVVKGRVDLPESELSARWVGMMIEPADDKSSGREWVSIRSGSGSFETKRLIPGSYKAQLWGSFETKYEKMSFLVPRGGISNLVLSPKPVEPQAE